MRSGLQTFSFTWPGGREAISPTLPRAVRTADDPGPGVATLHPLELPAQRRYLRLACPSSL
jgi:hypothetical protein